MIKITAKCVGCGKKRQIGQGDIKPGDHPMCDQCGMPMIADKATLKK